MAAGPSYHNSQMLLHKWSLANENAAAFPSDAGESEITFALLVPLVDQASQVYQSMRAKTSDSFIDNSFMCLKRTTKFCSKIMKIL